MKFCADCGEPNSNLAKFCNACATAFEALYKETETVREIPADRDTTLTCDSDTALEDGGTDTKPRNAGRKADIMFVLDCTGSMQEVKCDKGRNQRICSTISSEGVHARVGLVAFRDRLAGEEPYVLHFKDGPFTADAVAFATNVSTLKAEGGGDIPESSLDALILAVRQPFGHGRRKVIVLITDAPPHIPDRETSSIDQVVEAFQSAEINQAYLVIRTMDESSQVYLRLLESCRGVAFKLVLAKNYGLGLSTSKNSDVARQAPSQRPHDKAMRCLMSHAVEFH